MVPNRSTHHICNESSRILHFAESSVQGEVFKNKEMSKNQKNITKTIKIEEENIHLFNDLIKYNEIFEKDITYNNLDPLMPRVEKIVSHTCLSMCNLFVNIRR